MAVSFPYFFIFSLFLVISASASCIHQSKVSYFSSSSAISTGDCGYGSLASTFNRGFVAAASSEVYRDGIGCGDCFQIRCKHPRLCSTKGVTVIVTDQMTKKNDTDFALNAPAFLAMARDGFTQSIKEIRVIDVEYHRIRCNYKNKNLSIRVEESSHYSNNLTIKFLYQDGQTDIQDVEVAQFGSSLWKYLTRSHGPIWTTDQSPAGPLQLRMVVTGGYDGKWVWAQKEVLPSDWMVGAIYDTGVQITDVAQDGCGGDGSDEWK